MDIVYQTSCTPVGDDPVKDDELEFGLRVDAVGGVITALHKHNGAQLWSKQVGCSNVM